MRSTKKSLSDPRIQEIEKVIQTVHEQVHFGSTNIKPITHIDPHNPLIDTFAVSSSLKERRQGKQRKLDALLLNDSPSFLRPKSQIKNRTYARQKLAQKRYLTGWDLWGEKHSSLHLLLSTNLAKEFSAANCDELSLKMMFELRQKGYTDRLDVLNFEYYDHVFLVYGLPKDANFADYHTWKDSNALIIDPWLGTVYPASEFGRFWRENIHFLNKTSLGEKELSFELNSNNDPLKTEINLSHEYIFPAMDRWLEVLDQPDWLAILINSYNKGPKKDRSMALALFKIAVKIGKLNEVLFANIGAKREREAIVSAKALLKIFKVTHRLDRYDLQTQGCSDLYKKEFDAGTATPAQQICYFITAKKLTGVDVEAIKKVQSKIIKCVGNEGYKEILAKLDGQSIQSSKSYKNENIQNLYLQQGLFQKCDFSDASLTNCKFQGANLHGCNLSNVKMQNCSFLKANLSMANLMGASLKTNDFEEANLQGTKFFPSSALLNEVNLRKHLDFLYAEIRGHSQQLKLLDAIMKDAVSKIKEKPDLLPMIYAHPIFTKHLKYLKRIELLETNKFIEFKNELLAYAKKRWDKSLPPSQEIPIEKLTIMVKRPAFSLPNDLSGHYYHSAAKFFGEPDAKEKINLALTIVRLLEYPEKAQAERNFSAREIIVMRDSELGNILGRYEKFWPKQLAKALNKGENPNWSLLKINR